MSSWKVTQQSGLTSAAPRTLSLVAETRSLAILKPNGKRRETHVSDVLRLDTSAGTPCELTVLLRLGGAKTMEKSFGFASASERNSFVAALRSVRDGVADAASDASTAALDAAPGFGDHTPWLPVTPWRAPLPQLLLGEERTRMPRVRASTLIAGSWSSLSTKESAMHWSVHGTALITTFGVRFTVFPAERRRCRFAALSVPALSIARVAVEGEWIVMYCKDMRVVRLCVDAPQRARLKFAAALRNRALPPEGGERELAFAVAHCTARGADRTSGGNGWGVYDPQQELDRMVSGTPAAGAWTLVSNAGFQHVETYASALLVPSTFTSDDLRSAGAARSKGRMAAATWLYPQRGTVLLRASMPSIGLGRATGDKPQLEKYVAAATVGHAGLSGGAKGDRAGTLWIADARPVLNAQVTRLKGGGAEFDIPNLSFHNIENIHVMRASASLLVAACTPSIGSSRTSDGDAAHAVASAQPAIADGGFLAAVDQSKWLQYVATVLAGATSVAELLHGRVDPRTGREVDATSVLVHCSDGWDRTAQLCAIAQLILDPFFRTTRGFCVLIQKEWCDFGHKFHSRMGHAEDSWKGKESGSSGSSASGQPHFSSSESSPVFIQFLDCVWQLTTQFPTAFEFNESLLLFLARELCSCRYGTFLGDNARERVRRGICTTTASVWEDVLDATLAPRWSNARYAAPSTRTLIWPSVSAKRIRLWEACFLQNDADATAPIMEGGGDTYGGGAAAEAAAAAAAAVAATAPPAAYAARTDAYAGHAMLVRSSLPTVEI